MKRLIKMSVLTLLCTIPSACALEGADEFPADESIDEHHGEPQELEPTEARAAVKELTAHPPESTADVGIAAVSCDYANPVAIKAFANGLWVSAELAYPGQDNGMLRARAPEIGPWEVFFLCFESGTGRVAFQSAENGLFVSAEKAYPGRDNGMLRARAPIVGPWELFTFEFGPGYVSFRALANNRLVSVEKSYPGGDSGMLRARAISVDAWEKFQLF